MDQSGGDDETGDGYGVNVIGDVSWRSCGNADADGGGMIRTALAYIKN